MFPRKNFVKSQSFLACVVLRVYERGHQKKSPAFAAAKGGENMIAEALRSLPEEKREAVLLYYFFDMSETEISRLCNIPRTTVKYRRNSSFGLLKRYLEEHAYDCTDWEQ